MYYHQQRNESVSPGTVSLHCVRNRAFFERREKNSLAQPVGGRAVCVLSWDESHGTLACIGSELADVDVEDSQHLIATEGEKGMCSVHPSEAVFKCTE